MGNVMAEHIKPLTTLRGVAALLILLHHFLLFLTPQLGNVVLAYTHFFHNGYLWVDFFFVLSGFILAHVYLTAFATKVNSHNYRSFLFSRFARIYPLHLFMLLAFLSIELLKAFTPNTQPFTGPKSLTGLFTNLVLLQTLDLKSPPLFGGMTYWNAPAWSISAEWLTYTIFPFLLLFLFRKKRTFDIAIYVTALVGLFLLIEVTYGHLDFSGLPAIGRCILECSIGILMYKVYQRNTFKRYLSPNSGVIMSIAWILLVMHYDWHDVLIIPAFSLLILSASTKNKSDDSFISMALNSRLMVYLGTISYAIYMVHWFIQEFVWLTWRQIFNVDFESNFHGYESAIALSVCILIVLVVAALTYRFVEIPMQSYLKNLVFSGKYIYGDKSLPIFQKLRKM